MQKLFDIAKFNSYKEDNRREVKRANGGLPNDMWETYSAFANTYGGVIILGVKELDDKHWKTTGLKMADKEKLMDDLQNMLHNPQKVNINILTEKDIETYEVEEDLIIVIYVPKAKRAEMPVYINNDMFGGTFRRDGAGDYHCTRLQVKSMLRDQTDDTMDMEILNDFSIKELNYETIHAFRNSHRTLKPGHPFERLDDNEYLRSIGAAAISNTDGELHPTAAGMLMFGDEYNIIRQYPEYFLDYRESFDPTIRWTDRLQSSSGEWSGNVFDFYFRVYNKVSKDIKLPFMTVDGKRVEDTPIHKALREALANCLVNADYFGVRGVVIRKIEDKLILENPGSIRTGKEQMLRGGLSDPRNKVLLKMFNLIDIGERSGSGVPDIFNAWADEGWVEPIIEEQFNPDRTILTLEFKKKPAIKTGDKKPAIKTGDKKVTPKTQMQYETILTYMEDGKEYGIKDFCELLNLKESRTKEVLKGLSDKIEIIGSNKDRRYKKKMHN